MPKEPAKRLREHRHRGFNKELKAYASFIRSTASKHATSHHDRDDLIQEGRMVLWDHWTANMECERACNCDQPHPGQPRYNASYTKTAISWKLHDLTHRAPARTHERTFTADEHERLERTGAYKQTPGKRTENAFAHENGSTPPSVRHTRTLSRHAQVKELALQGKTRQKIADAVGYSKRQVQRILNERVT